MKVRYLYPHVRSGHLIAKPFGLHRVFSYADPSGTESAFKPARSLGMNPSERGEDR